MTIHKSLLGAVAATALLSAGALAQSESDVDTAVDAEVAAEPAAEGVDPADTPDDEVVVEGRELEPVYWERYKPVPLEYQRQGVREDGSVEQSSSTIGRAELDVVADYGAAPPDSSPADPMSALYEDQTSLDIEIKPKPEE